MGTPPPPSDLDDRVRAFEREWVAGRAPALDDHLAGPDADALLVELVHVDLEFRLKAGQPAAAADYFARYPELAADPDAAVELIRAEFDLRRRTGSQPPDPGEYPEYRDRLGPPPLVVVPPASVGGLLPWPAVPGYEVLDRLGRGGMGVVYKARDARLGRTVALKFLPPEFAADADRLARFRREARTASALNHPHICTIHDLGDHAGRPFLVMEFIDGRTLSALVGKATPAEAARLMSQAARALAAAHAAGVVHQDVKPDNLMVRADGYVKVLDFGLARRLPGSADSTSARDSAPGTVAGTVAYMAPEQARGDPPAPPADVFSLGVVLYELLTGRHPFPAAAPLARLAAIADADPVPPAAHVPGLPPALSALVLRMLAKSPAARPTAAEVDAALSVVADDVGPPPPTPLPAAGPALVGRSDELAALGRAFAAAAAGAGLTVAVVGEPGIGKTSLVEAFLRSLPAGAAHLGRGRCPDRPTEADAYLPVLDLLDGLLHGPAADRVSAALRAAAPTWYAELTRAGRPPAADDTVTSSPARMKRELVGFVRALGRSAPVVLWVDDLHRADPSTADLLAYLGRYAPGLRLLVLVCHRPGELLDAAPELARGLRELVARSGGRELFPRHLSAGEVQDCLDQTFPGQRCPPTLAAAVHARTAGNPLFVADLFRYLRDRRVIVRGADGAWRLTGSVADAARRMPDTVRGLVRRKLAGLDRGDRRLLAAAALAGGEFESAALARLFRADPARVDDRLDALDRRHALVRVVREHAFPDGTRSRRFAFAQAVYREELAAAVPAGRRAEVCRAVADVLHALYAGRPGAAAGDLARLYEAGGEPVRAADLYRAAAEAAARVFAPREAAALARRGLGLLAGLPASDTALAAELRLQTLLGLQLQVTDGFAAAGAADAYDRARRLWDRVPAAGPLFPIVWGQWLVAKVRSDLGRAKRLAGELLDLAARSGDTALTLQAHQAGAVVALCRGDFGRAADHMRAADRLYDPPRHAALTFDFGQDPGVACLSFGAVAEWLRGDAAAADAAGRRAVALARAAGQPSTLALALHFAAMLAQLRGDPAGVRELAGEGLAVAVENGFAFWQAGALVLFGWAAAAGGGPGGLAMIEQGLGDWQATGSLTYRTYYLGLLADAYLRAGRPADAVARLDEADALMTRTGERLYAAELKRLRERAAKGERPA